MNPQDQIRTDDTARKARSDYNAQHGPAIHATAMAQSRADKSDPFAYARTMSHYANGIATGDDYSVEFRPEQRKAANGSEFTIQVPFNMKRP